MAILRVNLIVLFSCACLFLNGHSYEYYSEGTFSSIHVLTVDPKEHTIKPVKASENMLYEGAKIETVLNLAINFDAKAAVSGGFWKPNGLPAGVLKINNQWYGTPVKPRGAIGWSCGGQKVIIDQILTNYNLSDAINQEEIEVIPQSIPQKTTQQEWQEMEHIVGGTPVLISQGVLIEDYSSEKTLEGFLTNRHPRTAVGIKENGEWVFVVVDGRFYGFLGGMTMKELALFMLELGCVDALNLGGGASSTMVIEGVVVNQPCGKISENGKNVSAISDAILIFSRE